MLLSELIRHLKGDLLSITFYPNSSSSHESKRKGKDMKSWCEEELHNGTLNLDNSRDPELGAE